MRVDYGLEGGVLNGLLSRLSYENVVATVALFLAWVVARTRWRVSLIDLALAVTLLLLRLCRLLLGFLPVSVRLLDNAFQKMAWRSSLPRTTV